MVKVLNGYMVGGLEGWIAEPGTFTFFLSPFPFLKHASIPGLTA